MADPYALLGLVPQANNAEVKAAYHRQLRQFPAHSHPQEFQQIRAAYEAIRAAGEHRGDPLQPGPLLAELDPAVVASIEAKVRQSCELSLDALLRLTF